MIKIQETINKSLTVKGAYMDGNVLVDEDGGVIDLNGLLQKTYGDGVQFDIKVCTKINREVDNCG